MKLRIKGNTIRLRLSKPEVEKLCSEGMIKEQTNFANTPLVYSLQKNIDTNIIKATFNNNELAVYFPASFTEHWAENNTIGFDNMNTDGSQPELYILVEKDFKCIDNSLEDQSNNYDNPKTC